MIKCHTTPARGFFNAIIYPYYEILMQLRPHQQTALDAMQKHSKGQIIVPTGGGKTLVAIKDAVKRLNGVTDPTLVVVAHASY